MARARTQETAEDDFYEEDDETQGAGRQEGQEDADVSTEGAADDAGEEQEARVGETVGEEDDDFFEPQPTRGENRQQRLANENRRLAAELEEERRARREPAQSQPTGPREESQQEFEARISLLPADERMEQRHIRWERRQEQLAAQNQQALNAQQVQSAVERDRAGYEIEAKTDARMARFQDRVEAEFQKRMRAGQPVARKDLYYWLLGQQVSGVGAKGLKQQREQARERVNRQTVRPTRSGSDVAPGRRGQLTPAQARAKRLENMQI
jgi:hypothetical protein